MKSQNGKDNDQRKDNDHVKVNDRSRIDESERLLKTITFRFCDTHNVRYPEGEGCPRCKK